MRKTIFTVIVMTVLATGVQAQKIIPENDSERRGAESYNKAVEAFSAGDFAASIPYFLTADSLIGEKGFVDRARIRYALASAYLKVGNPAQALVWFTRVAEADSTYPFILYHTAECARQAGKTDVALEYYGRALGDATDKQKLMIHERMAAIYEKKRDWKRVLQHYDQALAVLPSPQINLLRGQVYDRLAEPIDHAGDEDFNTEAAIKNGDYTEQKLQQAIELREKALADYRVALAAPELAAVAQKFIERSEVILQNDRLVVSEIKYQKENEE